VLVGLLRAVGPRLVGTSARLYPNMEAPRGEGAAALTWVLGVKSANMTVLEEDAAMVSVAAVVPWALALPKGKDSDFCRCRGNLISTPTGTYWGGGRGGGSKRRGGKRQAVRETLTN